MANISPVGEREKANGRNKLMQFQRSSADTIQLPENESSIHKIVVRAVSPTFFFFFIQCSYYLKIFHNTRLFLVKYLLYEQMLRYIYTSSSKNELKFLFVSLSLSLSLSVISFSFFLFCSYVKKTMDFLVVARNIGF